LRIFPVERLKKIDEKIIKEYHERQAEDNPELAKDQKQGEKYVKGEKWERANLYNLIIYCCWVQFHSF